jgi:predicted secreted hydrolase
MFYSLRRRSGARDPFSAGTWTAADGSFRHLSADDLDIAVLDHWKSARGGTYPARWRLRTPALGLDVEAATDLADQINPTPATGRARSTFAAGAAARLSQVAAMSS